jgi:hypothetical protein
LTASGDGSPFSGSLALARRRRRAEQSSASADYTAVASSDFCPPNALVGDAAAVTGQDLLDPDVDGSPTAQLSTPSQPHTDGGAGLLDPDVDGSPTGMSFDGAVAMPLAMAAAPAALRQLN